MVAKALFLASFLTAGVCHCLSKFHPRGRTHLAHDRNLASFTHHKNASASGITAVVVCQPCCGRLEEMSSRAKKNCLGEHRETGQGGTLLVNSLGSEISKLMESATICNDCKCQGINSSFQQRSRAELWLLGCFLEAAYPIALVSGKPCKQMGCLQGKAAFWSLNTCLPPARVPCFLPVSLQGSENSGSCRIHDKLEFSVRWKQHQDSTLHLSKSDCYFQRFPL